MNQASPARPLSVEELHTAFDRALDREAGEPSPAVRASDDQATRAPVSLDIAALMGLDDREFVEKAYAGILKRRPDEPGIRHYVAELAAGRGRIMVLGELRYSAEGRAASVPVPGLARRFLLHRLYRLPLLGRVLRTLTGLIALPGLMRDVARLSTELRHVRMQSENTDRAIEREMRSRAEFAEQSIERIVEHERQVTRELGARLDRMAREASREPWADPLLALADRTEAQAQAQARRMDQMGRVMEAATGDLRIARDLSTAFGAMREALDWPEAGVALTQRLAASLDEQRNLSARAIRIAEDSQALLREQERRLSLLLGEMRGWMAHGIDAQAPDRLEAHQDHLLDQLYVAFEDRFRGSRADIKQRQAVYLDLLRQADAGIPDRPIVDVGSGRGELLELLGEQGLAARGVDLNEAMVSLCVGVGLDCVQDDAVAYLSALEPGSLGAVTGFHIIEHLPFAVMVALFDASLRALASGGIVVFETPNPANLIVASRWFHLDPTHRNPLPAEMVAMIAEARGFTQVGIRELHPMARRFEAKDVLLAGQLDAIFHGPQDYALIARKA